MPKRASESMTSLPALPVDSPDPRRCCSAEKITRSASERAPRTLLLRAPNHALCWGIIVRKKVQGHSTFFSPENEIAGGKGESCRKLAKRQKDFLKTREPISFVFVCGVDPKLALENEREFLWYRKNSCTKTRNLK